MQIQIFIVNSKQNVYGAMMAAAKLMPPSIRRVSQLKRAPGQMKLLQREKSGEKKVRNN